MFEVRHKYYKSIFVTYSTIKTEKKIFIMIFLQLIRNIGFLNFRISDDSFSYACCYISKCRKAWHSKHSTSDISLSSFAERVHVGSRISVALYVILSYLSNKCPLKIRINDRVLFFCNDTIFNYKYLPRGF